MEEMKGKTDDDIKEGFTFNIERDVLDYDSGGYNFVVRVRSHRRGDHRSCGVGRRRIDICTEMSERRRAARRRKIGVVVGRERTVVLGGLEPLLVVGDGWDGRTSKMIRLTTGIELRVGFFNCNWPTVRGVYWEGAEMGGDV
jgi:hypothetical protein